MSSCPGYFKGSHHWVSNTENWGSADPEDQIMQDPWLISDKMDIQQQLHPSTDLGGKAGSVGLAQHSDPWSFSLWEHFGPH